MGVFTCESETTSVIPLARLFKALVFDNDNLILKVAPKAVKSVEIIEGNGGLRTIKKLTYGEGCQHKYVKHRVDEIDSDNLTYSFIEIEGNALGDSLEKISIEIKLEASSEGGTVIRGSVNYYTTGDWKINEEHAMENNEKSSQLFKAIEAYLLANPAYN